MSRKIGARDLPYSSSYDRDRIPMSRIIALILKTKKAGSDVQIDDLSKKEIDDVYSLDRRKWYETARSAGFFHLPDNGVFLLYSRLYERIKEKYGEKRRSLHHSHLPYWLPYFYFQKNRALFLKPEEECIEIMRGMPCPVFDDIKKKFEKSIIYACFLDSLGSYIANHYGDEKISSREFISLALSAGYTHAFIENYENRNRIIKKLREDGLEIKIIKARDRINNLVFHELQEREKKFVSSSELNKIIESFSFVIGRMGWGILADVRRAAAEKYLIVQSDALARVLEEACSLSSNGKIEKSRVEEIVKQHYSCFHPRFVDRACRALAGLGIFVK